MQPYLRGYHSAVTCTHSRVPQPAPGAAAPSPAPGVAAPGPPAPDSRVPGSNSRATGPRAPVSPELQALEATVAGNRHSNTNRRGLGSTPGRQTASAGQTGFTRASPVAQPQDMDCSPPMGALVLPPLHQCGSMDVDDLEPQTAQPAVSGAQPILDDGECDSPDYLCMALAAWYCIVRAYAATAAPARVLASFSLMATAWTLVHVTVLTMLLTVHPRDKSLTGPDKPWRMGPMAIAFVLCWTACRCINPFGQSMTPPQEPDVDALQHLAMLRDTDAHKCIRCGVAMKCKLMESVKFVGTCRHQVWLLLVMQEALGSSPAAPAPDRCLGSFSHQRSTRPIH